MVLLQLRLGINIGRRIEAGEDGPQERHLCPHRFGRVVDQNDERPFRVLLAQNAGKTLRKLGIFGERRPRDD
ncbi:hypothetical protein D3C73_1345860 [compost metagenome]